MKHTAMNFRSFAGRIAVLLMAGGMICLASCNCGNRCGSGDVPLSKEETAELRADYKSDTPEYNSEVMNQLRQYYYFGQETRSSEFKLDYSKAIADCQAAAAQGNPDAQFDLGWCYEHGEGMPLDYGKAVELYTLAAQGGNVEAQTNLGYCYAMGIGVDKDIDKARSWFTNAAANGSTKARQALNALQG